jgi:hypothetical protein
MPSAVEIAKISGGGVIGLGVFIGLIVIFATLDVRYVTISLLPFIFILCAVGLIGLGVLISYAKIDPTVVSDVFVAIGTIIAVIIVFLFFVSNVCMRIRPTEMFTDTDAAIAADAAALSASISVADTATKSKEESTNETKEDKKLKDAETQVCKMVSKANDYIKANVGIPGIKKPELITAALQKARDAAAVKGSILTCPVPPKNEGLQPEERLNRMDRTLDRYVEPEIKKACIKAGICPAEGFADPPPQALDVDQRIGAILTKINTIKAQYLDAMDAKTADLQKGIASDSDKKAGADSAMTAESQLS